jgi:hypothetical protein
MLIAQALKVTASHNVRTGMCSEIEQRDSQSPPGTTQHIFNRGTMLVIVSQVRYYRTNPIETKACTNGIDRSVDSVTPYRLA